MPFLTKYLDTNLLEYLLSYNYVNNSIYMLFWFTSLIIIHFFHILLLFIINSININ